MEQLGEALTLPVVGHRERLLAMLDAKSRRASRVCEYAMEENILPDLRWHPRYAHPEMDEPDGLILSANWNNRTRWDAEAGKSITVDDRPSRVARILERLGCALEWCDEWTSCDECDGAVRTQPDSYHWTPFWKRVDECTIVCLECWDEDEHGSEGGAS